MQLTVQARGVLERFGFAFSIGVPPLLAKVLGASGVELESLDGRMLVADEPADALLAAADVIFKQTEIEQPVIVLVPGNPLLLNSLSRFLVAEGRSRDLTVQRLAGVSQLDVIVNELGIDIAAHGLQVFDVVGVSSGRSRPVPTVPAVLLRLADLVGNDVASMSTLRQSLASIYRIDHPVTLFNIDPTGDTSSFATAPLSDVEGFLEHIHGGSSLFLAPTSA